MSILLVFLWFRCVSVNSLQSTGRQAGLMAVLVLREGGPTALLPAGVRGDVLLPTSTLFTWPHSAAGTGSAPKGGPETSEHVRHPVPPDGTLQGCSCLQAHQVPSLGGCPRHMLVRTPGPWGRPLTSSKTAF